MKGSSLLRCSNDCMVGNNDWPCSKGLNLAVGTPVLCRIGDPVRFVGENFGTVVECHQEMCEPSGERAWVYSVMIMGVGVYACVSPQEIFPTNMGRPNFKTSLDNFKSKAVLHTSGFIPPALFSGLILMHFQMFYNGCLKLRQSLPQRWLPSRLRASLVLLSLRRRPRSLLL